MGKSKNASIGFLTITLLCALIVGRDVMAQEEPLTGQHEYTFDGMEYLLFLPSEYNEKSLTEWPMILYLHGAGAGSIGVVRTRESLPIKVDNEPDFPFIVLSPVFVGDVESKLLDAAFDLLDDIAVN